MKNILLITVDALGARLASGGGEKKESLTPYLDKIFETGVIAENSHSVSFPTQFAMPGLVGGQLPLDKGGYHLGMLERGSTIAQMFKKMGYKTIGITTDYNSCSCYGYDNGFDDFVDLHDIAWHLNGIRRNDLDFLRNRGDFFDISEELRFDLIRSKLKAAMPYFEERLVASKESGLICIGHESREIDSWHFPKVCDLAEPEFEAFKRNPNAYINSLLNRESFLFNEMPGLRIAPHYPDAEYVLNVAFEKISSAKTPYFAWVHLTDVHGTLTQDLPGLRDISHVSNYRLIPAETAAFSRLSQKYPGEGERSDPNTLKYIDGRIERLMARLESANASPDVLCFTADHGDHSPQRSGYGAFLGVFDHLNLYNELLHVPLKLVDFKRPAESRKFSGLISTKDIGGILAAYIESKNPIDFVLKSHEGEYLIAEHALAGTCYVPKKPLKIAVFSKQAKIVWYETPSSRFGESRLLNVFDRTDDPDELNDMGLNGIEKSTRLGAEIHRLIDIARDRAATVRRGY